MPENFFVEFRQGMASYSAPSKEFEALLLQRLLSHDRNPIARWMAANVSLEFDVNENFRPSKKKSAEKIDGIVMSVMALGLSMTQPAPKQSVYETRSVRMV